MAYNPYYLEKDRVTLPLFSTDSFIIIMLTIEPII